MDNLSILKNKKILYVEDDQVVRESISRVLNIFFDDIVVLEDGEEAMNSLHHDFDIIILDLNLPKYNGIEIAKAFRTKNSETLIFMISNYQEIQNLRDAMKVGAIDFLSKPISFDELKTVLEECANRLSKNIIYNLNNNLIYNSQLKTVFKNNEEIKLTKNEIIFLELVISNKNQVLTYDMITNELFNSQNSNVNLPSIKNMVLRLRKKLNTNLVESIFGVGYRVL
jgi:DNA-binding response OmpR family regulator